jgi:hypothetical protein
MPDRAGAFPYLNKAQSNAEHLSLSQEQSFAKVYCTDQGLGVGLTRILGRWLQRAGEPQTNPPEDS